MPGDDLEAWKAPEPPAGFAERVVAAARREASPRRPGRFASVAAGVVLVVTVAAAVLAAGTRADDARGEITARAREEARVGTRSVAVLEPGARVRWDGAGVEQTHGDVFWRVEPGGPFVLKTPGGEVAVKGTCFRVKVLGGAGIAAVLAVFVYEGRVVVRRGASSLEVGAGQTAEANERGVAWSREAVEEPEGDGGSAAPAEHAVAALDRARADRMREELRALFAKSGPAWGPAEPSASASASAAPRFPTMPVVPAGDAEGSVDPKYVQSVVRGDFFPLARECYAAAAVKNPALAGTVELKFKILGDPAIGGVVSEATLGDKTTIDDAEMQTCMKESMMSVTFAAPPHGGEVSVTYPIEFSPEDPDGG
jgi:hypothetical protein